MHCELVVPGMFGGPAAARLPSVELLLARGRCASTGSRSLESWLAEAFELEGALPAGAATLLAAGGDPAAQAWARADPVHLRLMRDRLILVPPAALRVRREEADVLAEALNRHFAGRLELQVIDAERWVARLAGDFSFGAEPPLELAGRDVDLAAGRGSADRDARRHQLLNESQMVLHEHALNEAREARGEPAINSLWFWGAGRAPQTATNRWQSVSALEPVALGLSRAAKIRARSLPASAQEWLERAPEDGRHLVVLDALRAPLALAEPGEYGDALAALEGAWFAPLLGALRAGRIGMLTVHVPDGPECASFETIRADLRRFWRRPKALERYT